MKMVGLKIILRAGQFLLFITFTVAAFAQSGNKYQRLPSDYDSLEWAATVAFTEGPTVDRQGNVYFSEQISNRIFKLSTEGRLSTFRRPSNVSNGLIFDMEGRFIACEQGMNRENPPRITRTDMQTNEVEVIAERFGDKRINQPNDVTIDGKGRIYFSDAPRGYPIGEPDDVFTGIAAVYRIDTDGTINRILTEPEIRAPNGLIVSPDDKTFYLVDSGPQDRVIRSYDLAPDGTVSNMRVFHDFNPGRGGDGLAIDTEGNLYVAAGLNRQRGYNETLDTRAGIYVFIPSGDLKEFIPIPEDTVSNCAFGGPDMKTLYITAGKSLLTVKTKTAGTMR